ncbi:hypothetical protein [Streptomyces sp. NPDC058671]|uniref:hypothetical protein n=1 Tax=Streptomyces sp. NPDC058671 TaxID=3346590 RepID=UPI003648AA0B
MFVPVLIPQARQWLQLHGGSIATVTVAVLAAGALTLLLAKTARCGASAWAARRRRPEGWASASWTACITVSSRKPYGT